MNRYRVMEDWPEGRSFYFKTLKEAEGKAREILRIERRHMRKSDYERNPRASVLVMYGAYGLWGTLRKFPLASDDMVRRWNSK